MTMLPVGWVIATIPEVADVLDSLRIPLNAHERAEKVKGKSAAQLFPYFGATGQVGYTDDYLFDENLVLLGEDGVPFFDALKKKAYRVSGKSWVNNHAHVLRTKDEVLDWRLLEAQLNGLSYVDYVSGSTRLKLTQAAMNKLPILVPPLLEQRRIADKLDTVLARVDAVQDRLARIAPLLKRFRQSVLAAATSGRLTEDWRVSANVKAAWCDVVIGDLAVDLRYGTSKKCDVSPIGTAVLRIPNVGTDGIPKLSDLKYAEFDESEISKMALKVGDILLIRSNGSVDLVGKTCVISADAAGLLFAGYLMRLRVDSNKILPKFIHLVLSSQTLRTVIENKARSTSGVNNINSQEVRSLPVSLPVITEQTEIVRRVEILFAYADRLEARLQAAQTATNRLTPALLAKAFRGELVPQDPSDGPASELLHRLREARAVDASTKPKRGSKAAV